jgi:hypothetical protein
VGYVKNIIIIIAIISTLAIFKGSDTRNVRKNGSF